MKLTTHFISTHCKLSNKESELEGLETTETTLSHNPGARLADFYHMSDVNLNKLDKERVRLVTPSTSA